MLRCLSAHGTVGPEAGGNCGCITSLSPNNSRTRCTMTIPSSSKHSQKMHHTAGLRREENWVHYTFITSSVTEKLTHIIRNAPFLLVARSCFNFLVMERLLTSSLTASRRSHLMSFGSVSTLTVADDNNCDRGRL